MNRHSGHRQLPPQDAHAIVPAPGGGPGRHHSDSAFGPGGPGGPGASGGGDGESAFAVLDDRLRGRWRIAIVLGLLLGAAAGTAGYLFSPVLFTSHGIVHVASRGERVLYQTEENERLFQFDTTLRTKAARLESDSVIQDAVEAMRAPADPTVRVPRVAAEQDAVEQIQERLTVRAERGSEFIFVSFDDESPEDASLVVNAILDAFDVRDRGQSKGYNDRMALITRQEAQFLGERDELQQEIARLEADNIGAGREVLQLRLMHLADLQVQLFQLKYQRELMAATPESADGQQQVVSDDERTLAQYDPALADALRRRDAKLAEVRNLSLIYRPEYHLLTKARAELHRLETERDSALEAARTRLAGMGPLDSGLPGVALSMSELERQITIKEQQFATLTDEAEKLQGMRQRIEEKQVALADLQRQLDELLARKRVFLVENDPELYAGDADIEAYGLTPRHPSKDRRKPMAAIGFLGGLGLSVGAFFLLGTLDQRTYRSRQFRPSVLGARCLGVLPDLGRRSNPEVSNMATHCVHQIRNRIESARHDTGAGYALMVSGPFQGDGKTSLTMSLAWSYANAGYRTVVVDADLVGRGLSHHLRVIDRPGLREALRRRNVNGEVCAVPSVENLSVLSAGLDARMGPESIRRDVFTTLCAELRERFDIILVDTGPFVGSVEILPVASSVDGVVLTVQKGRSRAPLKSCIDELADMQVPCLGVVLNQADRSDCAHYVSSSVVSQRAITGVTQPAAEAAAPEGA